MNFDLKQKSNKIFMNSILYITQKDDFPVKCICTKTPMYFVEESLE
jgi:hypothetical protein